MFHVFLHPVFAVASAVVAVVVGADDIVVVVAVPVVVVVVDVDNHLSTYFPDESLLCHVCPLLAGHCPPIPKVSVDGSDAGLSDTLAKSRLEPGGDLREVPPLGRLVDPARSPELLPHADLLAQELPQLPHSDQQVGDLLPTDLQADELLHFDLQADQRPQFYPQSED